MFKELFTESRDEWVVYDAKTLKRIDTFLDYDEAKKSAGDNIVASYEWFSKNEKDKAELKRNAENYLKRKK